MNYKVLVDQEEFEYFRDNFLPELQQNEKFYCCLFARKKYCSDVPWIKSDKGQLKRFLSNKHRLESKIRQLHCEFGAFDFDGKPCPQEALAIYISPNPRDLFKVCIKGVSKLADLYEKQNKSCNPHQEILSEIQKSKGTKHFLHFDMDWKDDKMLQQCIDICGGNCYIVETRGGYHILIKRGDVSKIENKRFYLDLSSMSDGDSAPQLMPIPGCYQGGFVPRFVYKKK